MKIYEVQIANNSLLKLYFLHLGAKKFASHILPPKSKDRKLSFLEGREISSTRDTWVRALLYRVQAQPYRQSSFRKSMNTFFTMRYNEYYKHKVFV